MQITEENSIRLIIKKCFADEIKAGLKVREYRCECNHYINRMTLKRDTPAEGYELEDLGGGIKKYVKVKDIKYIVFQVGYSKETFTCDCDGWGLFRVSSISKYTENNILYENNHKKDPVNLLELIKDEFISSDFNPDEWIFIFSLGKTAS
jgi:hypothetical protein